MRRWVLLSVDLACVCTAAVLAVALRDNLALHLDRLSGILPYLGVSVFTAAIVFPLMGTDRGIWRYSDLNDFLRIFAAVAVAVTASAAVVFTTTRLDGVGRVLPILQAMAAVCLMTLVRVIARSYHARLDRSTPETAPAEDAQEVLLLVGISPIAELFLQSLDELSHDRVHIAGIVSRDERYCGHRFHDQEVLGAPEELAVVLRELRVHGVFVSRIVVTVGLDQLSQKARGALADVEAKGDIVVDYVAERVAILSPTANRPKRAGPPSNSAGGEVPTRLTLHELANSPTLARPFWKWKYALDRAAALGLIIFLSPLFLIAGLLTLTDVGFNIFFWQRRPGVLGRQFNVYKFRTMRAAYDRDGRSIPDALRSSAIGRFLRRCRLDELPQLFNILLGEMSFVGPRPLLPTDQGPEHRARLAVRPGLTGWAQVNGGREISASEKTEMDIWYICNASFRLDLLIAIRTARVIVFGENINAEAGSDTWLDLSSRGAQLLDFSPNRRSAGASALHGRQHGVA